MAEFIIKCTMDDKWVNHFQALLYRMELNGNLGHSEVIGFMSDGDGDFKPKFELQTENGFKKLTSSVDLDDTALCDTNPCEYYDAAIDHINIDNKNYRDRSYYHTLSEDSKKGTRDD